MHSLIDPVGNEITEHLNIKHENSRTDQVKGYKARVSGLHVRWYKINFVTPG